LLLCGGVFVTLTVTGVESRDGTLVGVGTRGTAVTFSLTDTTSVELVVRTVDVHGGSQDDVRTSRLSLTIKHVERVRGKLCHGCGPVKVTQSGGLLHGSVDTSDVKHELVVHEDPHVIISLERQHGRRVIDEGGMSLHTESPVVVFEGVGVTVVTPTLVVYGVERVTVDAV